MRDVTEHNTFMRSEQSDANGFVMVVLIIVMGIGAVWMAASLPAWKQQSTREKEAELVFRGTQYVRALQLYQRKNGPNTRPANIDILVDNKFLRRKYKDPITNDDFVPVTTSSAPVTPGAPVPGQQQTPGQGGQLVPPAQGRAGGGATPGATPGAQNNAGATFPGQVMGVMSKSTATSILVYKGASRYNEWAFTFTGQAQQQQGGPGGAGNNGRGAQGGVPTGPGGVGGAGRGGPGVGTQGPGRGGTTPPPAPTGTAGRGRGGF